MMSDSEVLSSLLAVIFRDGGHMQSQINNNEAAGKTAEAIVINMRSTLDDIAIRASNATGTER